MTKVCLAFFCRECFWRFKRRFSLICLYNNIICLNSCFAGWEKKNKTAKLYHMRLIRQVYRSHILTKAGHTSCCNSQSKHKQTLAYSRRFMVLWSSLDLIAKCSFLPAFKWGTLLSILMTVHVSVDLIFCSHLKPCGPSLTAKRHSA